MIWAKLLCGTFLLAAEPEDPYDLQLDSNECREGFQRVSDGSCAKLVYRKKTYLDFNDTLVEGKRENPMDYILSRLPAQFKCAMQNNCFSEDSQDVCEAKIMACLGVKTQAPCPAGTLWVQGKCRGPKYLERIPKLEFELQ